MCTLILSIYCLVFSANTVLSSNKTVVFYALSNLNPGDSGASVVAAQWLAIQEINNNPDLLPNYELIIEAFGVNGDSGTALVQSLNVVDLIENSNTSDLHFPIALGCPWSSLSSATSPVFSAFSMGQISSGATSVALSDSDRYPYFYRTIPSDTLQAEGIILLAEAFNWTKLAVVYVNDPYGLYLSIGIEQLSQQTNISVTTVAFTPDEDSTIEQAARTIKNTGYYIIIFIVHGNTITKAFDTFSSFGLTGYPYFYIGVDAWFDTPIIQSNNIQNYTQGFLGTIPWQTNSLALDEYSHNNQLYDIINESLVKYNKLEDLWNEYINNGYKQELYNITDFGALAIYGYDSLYTLVYAMEKYFNQGYNLIDGILFNMTILNQLILSTDFIGTSGRIVFEDNGDRADGLYGLGYIDSTGSVDYFGYFSNEDGILQIKVDYTAIIWPTYFAEKGLIPMTDPVITDKIQTISSSVATPLLIFSILSIILCLIYIFLTLNYRAHSVLKAASWKINIVMCFGGIFGFITVIIYGIDERSHTSSSSFTVLCNARLWCWTIAYTLLFMPLFVKTYRLSRIFNQVLTKKFLPDKTLLYVILICVGIDLLLLTIYTAIEPLKRIYLSGSFVELDLLQTTHYLYGSCETTSADKTVSFAFYGLISLWKVIQSLFGIYCAIAVSKVGRKEIMQFDETVQQLGAILFTIVALCITVPILTFGPREIPSFYYGVIGYLTISVGNTAITLNMAPRLYALIRGNDALLKYSQSPEDKMTDLVVDQLRKIGIDEKWWKKASTLDKTNEIFRTGRHKKSTSSIAGANYNVGGKASGRDISSVQTSEEITNTNNNNSSGKRIPNIINGNEYPLHSHNEQDEDEYNNKEEEGTDSDIADQQKRNSNKLSTHIQMNEIEISANSADSTNIKYSED